MSKSILSGLEFHLSNLQAQSKFLESMIVPHFRFQDGSLLVEDTLVLRAQTLQLKERMEILREKLANHFGRGEAKDVKDVKDVKRGRSNAPDPESMRPGSGKPSNRHLPNPLNQSEIRETPELHPPPPKAKSALRPNQPTRRDSGDTRALHVEDLHLGRSDSSLSDRTLSSEGEATINKGRNTEESKSTAGLNRYKDQEPARYQGRPEEDELHISYEDISEEVEQRIRERQVLRNRTVGKRKRASEEYVGKRNSNDRAEEEDRSETLSNIGSPRKKHRLDDPTLKRKEVVLDPADRGLDATWARCPKKVKLQDP